MSAVDRQRVAAVRLLGELGYTWLDRTWQARHAEPSNGSGVPLEFLSAADAQHDEIAGQIEDRAGCLEGTDDAAETLERLSDLAEADEAARPECESRRP